MTFEKLIAEYLSSPAYKNLAPRSKVMYEIYTRKLAVIGERAPLLDKDMPIAVAVARSRSKVQADKKAGVKPLVLNETCKNLAQFWYHSIDNYEEKDAEVSNSHKNTLLSYLKIVYKWGISNAVGGLKVNDNVVHTIKRWKHTIDIGNPATEDDIQALETAINNDKIPPELVCYVYWWIFLYDGGYRPGETIRHERSQFRKRAGKVLMEIWGAKGKQKGVISRLSVLTERQERILAWFDNQPKVGFTHYTFRTNRGKPFLDNYANEKLKEVFKLVGLKDMTTYDSRRGIATTLYTEVQAGTRSYKEISDRLGHMNERTAKRYISQNLEEQALGYRPPVAL